MSETLSDENQAEQGLRSRKKAKRRDEIIGAARTLFARQGIDATTMADIAAAAGISAPTVFNYFGSKDGILIALISEGTTKAREDDRDLLWQDGLDLGSMLVALFVRVSGRTLEIAGKRVWRYAESAAIRHPETELAAEYHSVSRALVGVLVEFLATIDLRLRAGGEASTEYLGQLLHDVWMPCFINLITDEEQTLSEHEAILNQRLLPLVQLLFDDGCLSSPIRKGPNA
ncbi:TetR/AcrR family transcriptional regulator [Rhizobium alvei]|uniref:TetR/AcrR family transcriptional regulator n=1 Tax=Rhizobium alvei TaxID=1132659 RepID=A0ABT8YNQ4_9HYPH|nr:TetR/AcrR family transcriptional regulator [Rhizobium alvei]MDO6965313.1 TetR/AcrR family transcriptional regulator [Rhizobium alvei]